MNNTNQLHTTLVIYFVSIGIFAVCLFVSHQLILEKEFIMALIPMWTGCLVAVTIIFWRMIKVIQS